MTSEKTGKTRYSCNRLGIFPNLVKMMIVKLIIKQVYGLTIVMLIVL